MPVGVKGMEKESREAPAGKRHTLQMENRQRAALTGVNEVIAFDDNQVILATDQGDIALTGDGLHVTRLMLEEGQLTVEGRIDSLIYSRQKRRRGLFRRRDG